MLMNHPSSRLIPRLALAALATAAGCSLLLADYPSTVNGLGPVGYYRMSETASVPADSAMNSGSAGELGNGYYIKADEISPIHPSPGALVGSSDTAAAFDAGLAQYVMVPFSAPINPTGSFTLEAWIQPSVDPAGLTSPLSFAHAGDPRTGWFLYQNNVEGGGWTFRFYKFVGLDIALNLAGGDVPVAGTWYHVAISFDAVANLAKLYVDGVEKASGSPIGYVPNRDGAFTIGARSDGAFAYNGSLDEVALYDKVIPASELLAHYQNGVNPTPPTPYNTLVQAQSPLLYYRLNDPAYTPPATLPVSANTGSWGSTADAGYESGVTAGEPGMDYAGFPAGNTTARLNGAFGGVVIPAGQPLYTDTVSFAGWVKPTGPQTGWNAVIFQRGSVQATGFGFGDAQDLRVHWNDGEYGWAPGLKIPADVWSFVAAVFTPTETILCVNGQFANNTAAHVAHDFSADPIYMGLDPTGGRVFKGDLDEVAIFDKALTMAQLTEMYNAALVPPVIAQQPTAPPGAVYEGMNVDLTVTAIGAPTLTFQWRKDGVILAGRTSSTLSLLNLATSASGAYDVVVNNANGSVTSAVVNLLVEAGPPIISTAPVSGSRYPGGTATFSVAALGSVPLSYQWSKGATPIPGATAATLTIPELSTIDAGDYTVTVTNPYGSRTATASLSILPITGNYVSAVLGAGPIGYWRMNETVVGTAADSQGGRDGTFNATVTTGVVGPRPAPVPGLESGNTALSLNGLTSDIIVPALNLNKNTMTIVAWINPALTQSDWAGVVFSRGGGTVAGMSVRTDGELRYTWNDLATTYNWVSGLYPAPDAWNFVAMIVEPNQGTLALDTGTGLQFATNPELTHPVQGFPAVMHFGTDPSGNRIFAGAIDEVAIYDRALSQEEITTLRNAAFQNTYTPTPITITQQPKSQEILVGGSYTLSVKATGSQPLTYQWQKNGADLPGAVRSSLSFNNATEADSGTYRLVISQGAANVTSATANFVVHPTPAYLDATRDLVLHLKFDGGYADSSGRNNNGTAVGSPSMVTGKIGSGGVRVATTLVDGSVATASYVTVGTPADLAIGPNQDFSAAFWVKLNNAPGDLPFFGNTVNSHGDPGINFAPSWEEGGWSWYISNAGSAAWQGIGLYDPVKHTLDDGAWHSLVHVFERSGDAITYLDGVKVHSQPIDAGAAWDFNNPDQEWIVGQGQGGMYPVAATFEMDDLGFWRRALTEFESQAISIVGHGHGRSFDQPAPAEVRLTVERSGNSITLGWSSGTLESSSTVDTGYSAVSGASAPSFTFTVDPASTPKFFRVRVN